MNPDALTLDRIPTHTRVHASSALSMPGFIGLYFGLRATFVFLFFSADPQAGATFSLGLNLLLLAPAAFFAAGSASIRPRDLWQSRPFRFVIGFLALALLSLAWSEAQSTVVAFAYWGSLAADVLLVLLLFRAEAAPEACESLMKGYVWGVLLLSITAWAMPTMPDLRIGSDEFLSPNVIGFECAFATLICQYLAPQGARWKWLGALLAITLLRSLSKSSIIAFIAGEAFFLLRARTLSRNAKLVLTLAAVLVLILFSSLLADYYTVYTHAGTQAETLTGRTIIWFTAYTYAIKEPWLGHGFHSFHTVVPAFGPYQAWHAHNELLQQFFTYGIIGVLLVIVLYVSFFRQLRSHAGNPIALLAFSILILVFTRSFADTERFDLSYPLWLMTAFTLTLSHSAQEASL